jgi:hypothetical protein
VTAQPAVKAEINVAITPRLVDKRTAALMLGAISIDQLEKLVAAGELGPKKIGTRVVFDVAELERFAAELPSWQPR